MVRYVISCKGCEFSADATCLGDLGLQLKTHADRCHDEPLVVLCEEDGPEFNSRSARAYSSAASLN